MTKEDILQVFNNLQSSIGRGNAERGFHAEGDDLRSYSGERTRRAFDGLHTAALRNYYMVKVGLIMSEGAEALEELRSGRPVDQNYYTHNGVETDFSTRGNNELNKPEGVPSEIADIVIRCLDFADEAGFSLIDAILEKLEYNDTRAHMHGRQV